MFVSKEKYNEAMLAFKKAEEELDAKDLLIARLEATIKTQKAKIDQSTGDQKQEIEALRQENLALSSTATTNDQIIINLTNEIDDKDQKIDELQGKLELIANMPATRASKAVSQSDGSSNSEDINSFMRNNRDDINVCMNKLIEEGF